MSQITQKSLPPRAKGKKALFEIYVDVILSGDV
jgi:hypothetical protein